MPTSVGLAFVLSTGFFAVLGTIPRDVLLNWAWRVPFVASSVIFGVALFIRRSHVPWARRRPGS